MIIIINGGHDLLEKPGAIELARETVEDGGALTASRALAARVVLEHLEPMRARADGVEIDRESERMQARPPTVRRAVDVRSGVVDLPDPESAQLRGEPVERDGEPAIAHQRRGPAALVQDA